MSRVQHVTVMRAGNDVELRCVVDNKEIAIISSGGPTFYMTRPMLAILSGLIPPMERLVFIERPSFMDGHIVNYLVGVRARV